MKSRRDAVLAEARERHVRVAKLLEDGFSVAEVCKKVGLTPKRVYVVARRESLPTNPYIWPQSSDESTIARLSVSGWTPERIARLFGHSPRSIERILGRIQKDPIIEETARRFGIGDQKGDHPRRRARKKAASAALDDRRPR